MKPKWVFYISLVGLLGVSIIILGIIYYVPHEAVVAVRELLFGITFLIWGIVTAILIVQKMLDMRDIQKWKSVNKFVFNYLYTLIWAVLAKIFDVYGVKIEVKESLTIERFGVEYMNIKHFREWRQEARKELENVVNEGPEAIKTNMQSWNPPTHKAFSEAMAFLKDEINELLQSYPHQIPPDFLSVIVDVRELARGMSNVSMALSDEDLMKEHGLSYTEMNISMIEIEKNQIHRLFSKLLKLIGILEKEVEPEILLKA